MSDDVKPGDTIALGRGQSFRLMTVDRVTATQIVCGTTRLSRRTRRILGSHGSFHHWRLATPDDILKHEIQSATWSLQCLKVTPENIGAVKAFLAEQNTKKDPSA